MEVNLAQIVGNDMKPPSKLSECHLFVRLVLLGVRLSHGGTDMNVNPGRGRVKLGKYRNV